MEGMVYQIIDNKLESRENILSLHVQQFSSYSYCIGNWTKNNNKKNICNMQRIF